MSISHSSSQKFGSEFLNEICDWIGNNLDPEDVFGKEVLDQWGLAWANEQDEWIPDPDKWARENGYVKE